MTSRDNYWIRRANSSRLSRRRFVGGTAAVGVGASALALVGCGDDDDDDGTPGGPTATSAPGETPQPTEPAGGLPQGGTAHLVSANNTWDTFDIDRSRFSPVAWLHGYTNLGVTQWASFTNSQIEGGMAESWEQPGSDGLTMVFKVRPNVFWHDKPPVSGRQATADDIVQFINRNRLGVLLDGTEDTNFYRKAAYDRVANVEETDAETVTVTFSEPDPFFISLLAGSYSKVLAPEAIEAFENSFHNLTADLVIGTGGFVLQEFAAEGRSRWSRHENFHAQVNWDGITWLPLFTDQSAQQTAFEQKDIDVFGPTSVAVDDELQQRYSGQIQVQPVFSGNPQAGTYFGGEGSTWANQNLIGAIFKAFDRQGLINSVLQGRGVMSGNVPPTQGGFALSEAELITYEGYIQDRTKDQTEAKAMWDAAGGPALGTIVVDIPNIWEGLYSGGASVITNQLKSVLGNDFTVNIEPYDVITGKVSDGSYGTGNNNIWYGWITEITDPEPTVLNFLSYNSSSPQWRQFGVLIPEVDTLTRQAMDEFDVEVRAELSKQVMDLLLKNWGAGIPYSLVGLSNSLRWNYFKYPEAVPFVQQHQAATQFWFDQTDPTWASRPTG